MNENEPAILKEGRYNYKDFKKFNKGVKVWNTLNVLEGQLEELFEIRNPELVEKKEFKKKQQDFIKKRLGSNPDLAGNWIYFPWNGNLLHTVTEEEHFELRTNRNRNLIDETEQKKLYNSCIGVVGLSVGSGIAVGLSYQGIAKQLKLAEFDNLKTTNLNRMRASVLDIGKSKINLVSQQTYSINPYAELKLYSKGLTRIDLKDFIYGKPKARIIFEIVDDFEMKVRIRMMAKEARIPVVGPANLGDRILIDVERYDVDSDLELFNGRLGDLPQKMLKNPDEDKNVYAVKMVEPKNIPLKALESVKEIGKTLVGRPQLSSTVAISGALGVYIARSIILGTNKLHSGRYLIDLDKLFN